MAEGGYELCLGVQFHMFKQGVNTYTFPTHIQLGPFGDTGDIHHERLDRELEEFIPVPGNFFLDKTFNSKCPMIQLDPRGRPSRQYWKTLGNILAGGEAIRFIGWLAFAKKATGNKFIWHGFSIPFTSYYLRLVTVFCILALFTYFGIPMITFPS
jgi:hypothetical protein